MSETLDDIIAQRILEVLSPTLIVVKVSIFPTNSLLFKLSLRRTPRIITGYILIRDGVMISDDANKTKDVKNYGKYY